MICICDMNLELNAVIITLQCGKPHYSNHVKSFSKKCIVKNMSVRYFSYSSGL